MAMATVRRRAVYALAVLALLCGCCSSVCGATSSGKVDVLCPSNEGKICWRVSSEGSSDWKECSQKVNYEGPLSFETAGRDRSDGESICTHAESWCLSINLVKKTLSPQELKSSNDATFTMSCTTNGDSEPSDLSKCEAVTLDGTRGDLLGTSGKCELLHLQPAAGEMSGPQTPVAQPSPSPPQAATAPSSEGTHHDGSLAGSSVGTGVPASNAAGQSGSAGSTGSQGTLTSPTDGADSSKATGDSGAQAPSASAQPSRTSTPDTPAGSDGGSATTTTTSSSPSGGKHTKGNADGSGTLTVWVRGTLLLLLTAAVACAAGE
ncbi:hypothetical protein TraAM80_10524 [Trypanosoma rangeli]|uniref:Mucin-like glycoprotein n=1 Tax=Trypanosoma rangeli TaxID=5698 RepID=A0A422MNV1_TRYRA|nr:uncharacterized protein TraAM80_10524 [Trypanosoma rangeli]RNE94882.1 hypothetical protein TraAM80_10524 [Trypanosoma rangeli]|eukprot:RNE94882.1 hypothetical protein TraAM80_10524 [Trypanosoma rangeli]